MVENPGLVFAHFKRADEQDFARRRHLLCIEVDFINFDDIVITTDEISDPNL